MPEVITQPPAPPETKDKDATIHHPVSKTELGRRLRALRAEIIASGEPLLDQSGIAGEIAERRGRYDTDSD